ncbi:MAG: TRCF domain-containing protein, partial [Eubacteriales bacterium]
QLYQLRGRVGRSDRKAYAYLFYPKNRALSEIAMKRLQVISDFTELGSGFKIAMKDMEIRGAGNLLGRDQSGDVYSVGFDMYLRLLNDAVNARMANKGEDIPQNEVLMELEYTGYIPDSYVHSPQTKMEIYKKIAAIETKDELYQVYNELEDRFGQIPDEVLSLLTLSEIRIICKSLYISTLKEKNGMVQVEFSNVSHISIDRILRLIKENTGRIKLDATKPNMLLIQTGKLSLKEKSDYLCEKLEFLVNK